MKILPVGANFFIADLQTGRYDKAKISFSQFCEERFKELRAMNGKTFGLF